MASKTSILNRADFCLGCRFPRFGVIIAILLFGFTNANGLRAQTFDKEIASVAERLSKGLAAKQKTKIAIVDFTDLEGRPTELGRFLAEQLSVEFVNLPGISVVDRANLKSILAEHKLSEDGFVNPETAKKLGKFAGVDAILLGTITTIGESLSVTIKAISTETAEIVAASKVTITRTKEIDQLSFRGVGPTANTQTNKPMPQAAAPLLTKDFGDLRITAKSVTLARVPQRYGSPVDTLYCAFEFTNHNTRDPLWIAANGKLNSIKQPHSQLRTNTGLALVGTEVRGLSLVSVYGNGSPEGIVQAIQSGRKMETSHGHYYNNERIWQGDLSTLGPGESVTVTVVFQPDDGSNNLSGLRSADVDFQFVMGWERPVRVPMVRFRGDLPHLSDLRMCNFTLSEAPIQIQR